MLPEEAWGDDIFKGAVKTKTVFPALILQMLHSRPDNGYGLMQRIAEVGGIFPINPNTIYPLLRRLEERGFVRGTADTSTRRRSMVYVTTPAGAERLDLIKTNLFPYITHLIAALRRLRNDLYGDDAALESKEQP